MVVHWRRIAWRGDVTFPIGEDESRSWFQYSGGFYKTCELVGNCPDDVDTKRAVETRGIESGRVETRELV